MLTGLCRYILTIPAAFSKGSFLFFIEEVDEKIWGFENHENLLANIMRKENDLMYLLSYGYSSSFFERQTKNGVFIQILSYRRLIS